MSNKEVTVSRAGAVTSAQADDQSEAIKAQVEAEFAAALEKQATLEVGITPPHLPFKWNVYARGPYTLPGYSPGRILRVGQPAYIAVVVAMNALMYSTVEGFEADILLNFWTSNTQTMQPIPSLAYHCCIEPRPPHYGISYSCCVWRFVPPIQACLCETNCCCRLCNCEGYTVPGYAAFVRWVENFDPEWLYPKPGYEFDNPIRYMVYDPDDECPCEREETT